jgi:hypothetical protein
MASMPDVDERYPKNVAALAALLAARAAPAPPTAPFRVGSAVFRAPPPLRAPPPSTRGSIDAGKTDGSDDDDVDDLLGELTDMLLVGAGDADSGHAEVHLQFKSDVFGGLHLRLIKKPEGLVAVFLVDDAATRRAVAAHVDALVARLRDKGFVVVDARLEVSGASSS